MKTLTLKSSAQLLLALLFLFFPLYLSAQEEEAQNCNRNRGITGLFGSPIILSGTQVYEGVGFLLGGNGAILFNDAFFIGMAYNALLPTRRVVCPIPYHDGRHQLFGIYGGLFFGHTLFSNNPLRFTGDMLVGLGGMTWSRAEDRATCYHCGRGGSGFRHPRSPLFMVLEPRVVMEWKLDREVGISLGVSYRYCPFFQLQYDGIDIVPRTAFNGISVSLAFTIHSRRR